MRKLTKRTVAMASVFSLMTLSMHATAQSQDSSIINPVSNPVLDRAASNASQAPLDADGLTARFVYPPKGVQGPPAPARPPVRPDIKLVRSPGAKLRLLDKLSGEVVTFSMMTGETSVIGRLEVHLDDCQMPVADDGNDAIVHLVLRDLRDEEPRFDGWMFASSPALSAMDHQRYDVWALSCMTVSQDTSSGKAQNDG